MKRSPQDREQLRVRAIALRQAGVGGKRIAKELGIGGALVCELLRGVPVPGSLLRPQAKDDLREAARLLREEGRTYDEIRDELAVSKSSLSLWLRDLPRPTLQQRQALEARPEPVSEFAPRASNDQEIARQLRRGGWLLREIAVALSVPEKTICLWTRGVPVPARAMHGGSAEHARTMGRRYWDGELARRELERQAVKSAASGAVGPLSERELELVAATAYWCEGRKDKTYARREKVVFINSDPGLLSLFYGWLCAMGTPSGDFRFRVHIHERADVAAAERYWADILGVDVSRFARATLKRHNPTTTRANTGTGYYGCLVISVCQSRRLYQHIAGVWQGIIDGSREVDTPSRIVQGQDNGL